MAGLQLIGASLLDGRDDVWKFLARAARSQKQSAVDFDFWFLGFGAKFFEFAKKGLEVFVLRMEGGENSADIIGAFEGLQKLRQIDGLAFDVVVAGYAIGIDAPTSSAGAPTRKRSLRTSKKRARWGCGPSP